MFALYKLLFHILIIFVLVNFIVSKLMLIVDSLIFVLQIYFKASNFLQQTFFHFI